MLSHGGIHLSVVHSAPQPSSAAADIDQTDLEHEQVQNRTHHGALLHHLCTFSWDMIIHKMQQEQWHFYQPSFAALCWDKNARKSENIKCREEKNLSIDKSFEIPEVS